MNTAPQSQYYSYTIAAAGQLPLSLSGTVLRVIKCNVPSPGVSVAFNGTNQAEPVSPGKVWDFSKVNSSFNLLIFVNTTTTAATITFETGTLGIGYVPTDAQLASTYALGNLGLLASGNYNGTGTAQPVTISGGSISLAPSATITVSGTNSGHQRKLFVITLTPGSSGNLFIQDANGCTLLEMSTIGSPLALETDSTLIIKSSGGTALFGICELYFAAL